MDAPKRKRGSNYTAQEINKLLDLVKEHKSTLEDKRAGSIYLTRKKEAWEKICTAYNALPIATSGVRTVEQLRVFYDNSKRRARKSLAQHNSKPQRNGNNEKLNIILKCCINLVKVHGRPIEMFDDQAFKELIELIDVPEEDRNSISTQYIHGLIDGDCEDDGSCSMEQAVTDASEIDDICEETEEVAVKVEKEGCTCDVTEVDVESDVRHEADCPEAQNQPFFNYFETLLDQAQCSVCHLTFAWKHMSELKTHLETQHPDVKFKHQIQPKSTLHNENTNDSQMRSKKRRRNSEEDKTYDTEVFNRIGNKIVDPPRDRAANTAVTLNDMTEIALDSFKTLDRFGLYVASLMSGLTKEKRLKYQEHIIHILLKEQAAAG